MDPGSIPRENLGKKNQIQKKTKEMLNLCKEYFDKLKVTISTNVDLKKSKTKCMSFGIKSKLAPITLHGVNLPCWEES